MTKKEITKEMVKQEIEEIMADIKDLKVATCFVALCIVASVLAIVVGALYNWIWLIVLGSIIGFICIKRCFEGIMGLINARKLLRFLKKSLNQ